MLQMMGVFAEFERAMIQERVRAGLRRAKDEGKQLGRPPDLEERILAALKAPGRTEGVRKIAARFRVDPSTVQRISRPFDGAAPPAERSGLFLSGRLFHWNADVVPLSCRTQAKRQLAPPDAAGKFFLGSFEAAARSLAVDHPSLMRI
jgi:hypothetical protein